MAAQALVDTVVVVTGGDALLPEPRPDLPADAVVVAADSGIELAQALGLRIDRAVGDFDSVRPDALQRAADAGAVVERHPAAKDATDLELALDAASALRPRRVVVLGGHGGRLDHLLGNALVLARDAYAHLEVVAQVGPARLTVVRTAVEVPGAVGETVSLLALHGPARGVTTDGLRYPLRAEDLHPGSSRGVSNELVAQVATVRLVDGVLLIVQPHPTTTDLPRTISP
ncbi:MAG: thiamine diphosphokinase [Acidimicrobiales bacterium]